MSEAGICLGGLTRLHHPFPPQIPYIFALLVSIGNLRGNRTICPPPIVILMNPKRGNKATVVRCGLPKMLWGYGRPGHIWSVK
eukprot:scaffold4007_cov49-Cyclotella_meneghiniana.AAC.6